jgi:hypothetical protein
VHRSSQPRPRNMTKGTSNTPFTSLGTPRIPPIVDLPPSLPPILVGGGPMIAQVYPDGEMPFPSIRDRPVGAPKARTPDFVAIAADLNRSHLLAPPSRSHQILRPRIGRSAFSIRGGRLESSTGRRGDRGDPSFVFGRHGVCLPAGMRCARGRGPSIPHLPLVGRDGGVPAARGYKVCPAMKPYRAQTTTSKPLYTRAP